MKRIALFISSIKIFCCGTYDTASNSLNIQLKHRASGRKNHFDSTVGLKHRHGGSGWTYKLGWGNIRPRYLTYLEHFTAVEMGLLVYLWLKIRFTLIRGLSEIIQVVIVRLHVPGPQLQQSIPGSSPKPASFFYPPSYSKENGRRYPVYIHIHGGGFIGGWTCEDREFCHYVAKEVDCVVISIAYRFAPEFPYPTGLQDCQAAVMWILQEYQPTSVAIGGFSAGGTLALGMVQLFKNTFCSVMASYSVYDFSRGSHHAFKEQNPLKRNMFHRAYLLNTEDTDQSLRNPLLSPRYMPESTLPESVVIIVAENDPNIKDMKLFGTRVLQERPSAIYKYYPGAFHGFMNLPDFALPKAIKAQKWDAYNVLVNEMKRVFASSTS